MEEHVNQCNSVAAWCVLAWKTVVYQAVAMQGIHVCGMKSSLVLSLFNWFVGSKKTTEHPPALSFNVNKGGWFVIEAVSIVFTTTYWQSDLIILSKQKPEVVYKSERWLGVYSKCHIGLLADKVPDICVKVSDSSERGCGEGTREMKTSFVGN